MEAYKTWLQHQEKQERAIFLLTNHEAEIDACSVLNAKGRCHSNVMYGNIITRNMPCLPLTSVNWKYGDKQDSPKNNSRCYFLKWQVPLCKHVMQQSDSIAM